MSTATNTVFLNNALANTSGDITIDGSVNVSTGSAITFTTDSSITWDPTGFTEITTTASPNLTWNSYGSHTHGSNTSFTLLDNNITLWGPSFKTKGAKRPRFKQYFKQTLGDRYFVGAEVGDDQVLLFDEVNGEVSIQAKTYVEKIKKWEYDLQMVYQI